MTKISYRRKDVVARKEDNTLGLVNFTWAYITCNSFFDARSYGYTRAPEQLELISRAGGLDKW